MVPTFIVIWAGTVPTVFVKCVTSLLPAGSLATVPTRLLARVRFLTILF